MYSSIAAQNLLLKKLNARSFIENIIASVSLLYEDIKKNYSILSIVCVGVKLDLSD